MSATQSQHSDAPTYGSAVSVQDDPAQPGTRRLVLRERVTVADAAELHRLALTLAAGDTQVSVDCTGVTHLDAAVVQVLIALGRAVEESGRRCVVMAGESAGLFRLAGLGAIVST